MLNINLTLYLPQSAPVTESKKFLRYTIKKITAPIRARKNSGYSHLESYNNYMYNIYNASERKNRLQFCGINDLLIADFPVIHILLKTDSVSRFLIV